MPAVTWSRVAAARDVVVAAVLVVLALVELASTDGDRQHAALAVVATAPLALRRSAPVPVLAVCLAALTLLTLRGEDEFTVAQLVALMLATYTVAVALPRRTAVVALAAVLAAALANSAASPSPEGGDFVFPVILLGVPWAAGVALRQWRARAEELRVLTEELRAEREAHARLVVSAERGRIARDLHDSLAQSLNGMVVHAEAAEAALGRDEARVLRSLGTIQQLGRASLTETRQTLAALRSEDGGGPGPGLVDLAALVEQFRAQGADVEAGLPGHEDVAAVHPVVQATAYRLVQEGLSNVVKHAPGSRVRVRVQVGDELCVEVADDGAAGPPSGEGYGLLGMRERVGLVGGRLEAGPGANGWAVRAWLPLGVGE